MTRMSSGMACRIIARLLLAISAVVLPVGRGGIAAASVYPGTFTYHNDNLRTGQNLSETILTPANVNSATFGKLFSYALDGLAFASPLYVTNVNIPGNGFHNVVFVETEHDSVYAFDADGLTNSPLWQVSFINPAAGVTPVPSVDTGEPGDITNEIGITSTPVIDPTSGTLYVVAKTKEISGSTTNYVQRLHALDIATGTEKFGGPVVIQGNVPGTGVGSVGGQVPFIPLSENQRTGLLLANGVVYFGFSSHGDNPPFYGWVMGYNATNIQQQVLIYNAAPNAAEAGIWMNGDGLACDPTGNVYFITGNGTLTANIGGSDYGDCFVKINPAGAVLDYFSPSVQTTLNAGDLDLGAGGVLLLPDQSGAHPHEMVSAGKNGTIYLVDRDNMGQFNTNADQIVESVVNIFPNNLGNEGGNFCSPVYFNGNVYFSPVQESVQAFQLSNGLLSTNPTSSSSEQYNGRGGTMAISANGNSNAILWVLENTGTITPGVLHAYDATNLGNEFYNSNQAGTRDMLDVWLKFNLPLVANGKVYVETASALSVFGNFPAAPTIAPNGGTFTNAVLVSLTNATPGSVIYYTLDNTDPTTNSALYAGPFSQTTSATVRARAFLDGVTGSAVASAAFTIIPPQPPSASFSGTPTTGLVPVAVTFTDSSTGTITNRSWTFGDGGTTNTLNTTVAYTYNSVGTDTVTLVVTGPVGVSTNTQVNYIIIIITNGPPFLIVAPGNLDFGLLPVGQGSTQTFSIANAGLQTLTGTATMSGPPFALVSGSPFTVNGGQTGLVSLSFSPGAVGAFTGSVMFASNGGVSTNAVTGSAAVAPIAGFTGNPTIGAATLLVNFADASSGTVISRLWNFGDGGASTLASPSYSYTTAGTFSVSLTVFGPLGSNTLLLANFITVTNLVTNAANTPPTVTLARPGNGMLYPPVTNLTITLIASASANDGAAISKIEFFADGTKLGETASNPGTNFLVNPTFGSHIIMARATDTLGATNTSPTAMITVGANNSPLGDWEITIGGADKGAEFLTFGDDFSASGYGFRLQTFGRDDVSGLWNFNGKGQVTGPFFEETGSTTNWTGTLLGTVKSLKSVNGTVPTASGTFHWKGIPATTLPDLAGTWTGLVTMGKTLTAVSYLISSNASDSAVFDIAASDAPGTVMGQLLVTSRNSVYGYVIFGGKPTTMFGTFSAARLSLKLKGMDTSAEKLTIKIFR